MKLLDLTLPTPEQNLALDEALLDACDGTTAPELLRIWKPTSFFVVAGYANCLSREVHLTACEELNIPVLRRCSGGGTVLQGPGCVNYSLILRLDRHVALAGIHSANTWIMERQRNAVTRLLKREAVVRGHTDLAFGDVKFSGNAQRRKRNALLFHGAFLVDMDLQMIARALRPPSKQPDYRCNRSHEDFLCNLRVNSSDLIHALAEEWSAIEPLASVPLDAAESLVQKRYSLHEWNWKFP